MGPCPITSELCHWCEICDLWLMTGLSFSYIALHNARNHACLIGSRSHYQFQMQRVEWMWELLNLGVMYEWCLSAHSLSQYLPHDFCILEGTTLFLQHTPPNWIVVLGPSCIPRVLTFFEIVEFWPLVELCLECPQAYFLSCEFWWDYLSINNVTQPEHFRSSCFMQLWCLYFSQLECQLGCWYVIRWCVTFESHRCEIQWVFSSNRLLPSFHSGQVFCLMWTVGRQFPGFWQPAQYPRAI